MKMDLPAPRRHFGRPAAALPPLQTAPPSTHVSAARFRAHAALRGAKSVSRRGAYIV
jgi:hypothetical protein